MPPIVFKKFFLNHFRSLSPRMLLPVRQQAFPEFYKKACPLPKINFNNRQAPFRQFSITWESFNLFRFSPWLPRLKLSGRKEFSAVPTDRKCPLCRCCRHRLLVSARWILPVLSTVPTDRKYPLYRCRPHHPGWPLRS